MDEADPAELVWSWRDTLALIGILVWGVAWTAFGTVQLADGPLLEWRAVFELFCLSVGLAGLYVGLAAVAIRVSEVLGSRRSDRALIRR